jgi:hypothetical protein
MRLRVGHISLQFSDSPEHQSSDVHRIFERATQKRLAWITGTEAGDGANNTNDLLLEVGHESDYKMWVPAARDHGPGSATDCWLAVRKDLVVDDWETDFIEAIPGSSQLYKELGVEAEFPKWAPKGLVTAAFDSIPQLGRINLAVAHHLTQGQSDGPASVIHGVDHHEWNEKLDEVIAHWMRETGHGSALAFASMDRNLSDHRNPDEIAGATSLATELKNWQNTGHGDIDWLMTHNKDARVRAHRFTVLDDREFKLNTDHFFVEGVVDVEELAA